MPTREMLSDAQRARFAALPEMDERELLRHHTLSEADLASVSSRRGAANRLGFAVQLCLLRYPGRPLRQGEVVPGPMVEFVASQVGADPDAFEDYAGGLGGAGRDTTRREHVAEIARTFGFRAFDGATYRELSRWLLPVAEGTDSGGALVGALLEEMRRRGIVAPALSTIERLAWETRRRAQERVFGRFAYNLKNEQLERLDSLLIVPGGEDETPLNRLRRPPGPPPPKNFKEVLDRLQFVRSLGLPEDAGSGVHHNRLTRLSREGAKTTPQHLRRFDAPRRHATLVAYLIERSAGLPDIALDMHDRMIGALMNRAEKMRDEGWTADVRYVKGHKLGGRAYVVSVMDNHSRAILSSAITRTQDLASYLSVLYAAVERYGSPEALVTDGGGVFRAKQARAVYGALGIAKHEIERGRPWQSYIETTFAIQRRMADWHFANAEDWSELAEAHDRFVEDYNAQRHFAHLGREDGRRTPSEVLGFVSGVRHRKEELKRAFFSSRFSRTLDALGYARFRHWRVYGEEGLGGREAALWLAAESLTLEHQGRPLSRYEVRVEEATGELREVLRPRLFESPHPPPQPRLFALDALGEGGWFKAMRLEGYAPRAPKRPLALQGALFAYADAWP